MSRMFWRRYDQVTTALLALAGFAMFGIAISNALLRYLFASPLVWAEELSRYAMIWGTLIGVAVAYRVGQHVAITLFADILPSKLLLLFRFTCHLLVLVTCALMIQSGWMQIMLLGGVAAPSSGLTIGWIYAAVPIGSALLAIEAIRCLAADLKSVLRPSAP